MIETIAERGITLGIRRAVRPARSHATRVANGGVDQRAPDPVRGAHWSRRAADRRAQASEDRRSAREWRPEYPPDGGIAASEGSSRNRQSRRVVPRGRGRSKLGPPRVSNSLTGSGFRDVPYQSLMKLYLAERVAVERVRRRQAAKV